MSTLFQPNGLSIKKRPFPMADTDRIAFTFDAEETITDAAAELALRSDGTEVEGPEVTVTPEAEGATVVVSGLTRGVEYELSVIFTREDATVRTRTLAIDCVA